jgi:hypothetical protein
MNTPPAQSSSPVPENLMDDLHKANEHFHDARVELEKQMDVAEPLHSQRVETASEGVRAAEREIEAVTEQIGKTLRGEDNQEPNPGHPPTNEFNDSADH